MRPLGLGRVRAALIGGARGESYLLQQVLGKVLRQGRVPHSHACAPVPRHPHQQDVVLRRRRSVSMASQYSEPAASGLTLASERLN